MMKRCLPFVLIAATGSAFAGVATMESKPVWDLADHGGPRLLNSANAFEIPNAAIPDVTAFTLEMRFRPDELPEGHFFKLVDQVVGWKGQS